MKWNKLTTTFIFIWGLTCLLKHDTSRMNTSWLSRQKAWSQTLSSISQMTTRSWRNFVLQPYSRWEKSCLCILLLCLPLWGLMFSQWLLSRLLSTSIQYYLIWSIIANALEDSIEESTLKIDVSISYEMLVTIYQTAWLYTFLKILISSLLVELCRWDILNKALSD